MNFAWTGKSSQCVRLFVYFIQLHSQFSIHFRSEFSIVWITVAISQSGEMFLLNWLNKVNECVKKTHDRCAMCSTKSLESMFLCVSKCCKYFTYMSKMEFFEAKKTVTDSTQWMNKEKKRKKADFHFVHSDIYSIILSKVFIV